MSIRSVQITQYVDFIFCTPSPGVAHLEIKLFSADNTFNSILWLRNKLLAENICVQYKTTRSTQGHKDKLLNQEYSAAKYSHNASL